MEQSDAWGKSKGLPPFSGKDAETHAEWTDARWPLPDWLRMRATHMRMHARLVDYWAGDAAVEARRIVRKYLEHLGFSVEVDDRLEQSGVSCGYVAARVVVQDVLGL